MRVLNKKPAGRAAENVSVREQRAAAPSGLPKRQTFPGSSPHLKADGQCSIRLCALIEFGQKNSAVKSGEESIELYEDGCFNRILEDRFG